MVKLLLKFHSTVVKEVLMDKPIMTIGRKTDNDIQIDNMAVSSHHSQIIRDENNNYMLHDLQSTNGTFLNNKKISAPMVLRHQDNILIGQHVVTFINPIAETAEQAPPKERPAPIDSEATIVITPNRVPDTKSGNEPRTSELEMDHASNPITAENAVTDEPNISKVIPEGIKPKIGVLKVVGGKTDAPEFDLVNLLTYIGKSESAQIKIHGLFVPDIIAVINRRQDTYSIRAIKENYLKINKSFLTGKDQVTLKVNDIIEVGGISFVFQMIDDPYVE